MSHLVTLACFLFAIHITTAKFDVECPLESSRRPSNLQMTSNDDTCGYYVAMAPNEHNSDFLDVYLEGKEVGWVAIGFSHHQRMSSSDIIGCKQDKSGNVGIINSWNGDTPPNKIDPTQEGMCNHRSEYKDGKFSCLFSRYYGIINIGYDYLLNDSFYLLLGCSQTQTNVTENFPFHLPHHPIPTKEMYNPFTYDGNKTIPVQKPLYERRMIRAHGILMVIAYPILLVTGIFFAAWMKPAIPKLWFQIHRALMLTSLGIAIVSFMLIFVANKDNPTPGIINLKDCGTKTTHFIFGITVIALQLLNPIIALIRCKPDDPNRWIFNLLHGSGIGLLTEILALINIALGAAIFQSNCDKTDSNNMMLWLYLTWCGILVITQMFLYIYFTFKVLEGDVDSAPLLVKVLYKLFPRDQYVSINEDNKATHSIENKVRYGVFSFQLGLTILIGLILIIFIAVDNFY